MSKIFLIVLAFLGYIAAEPHELRTQFRNIEIIDDIMVTTFTSVNSKPKKRVIWLVEATVSGLMLIFQGLFALTQPTPQPQPEPTPEPERVVLPPAPPVYIPPDTSNETEAMMKEVGNIQNNTARLLTGAANVLHGAAHILHGNANCTNVNSIPLPLPKELYVGNTSKVNFFEAQEFCSKQSKFRRLATIRSKAENQGIVAFFKSEGVVDAHFWISGWDLGHEGTFVWVSTGFPIVYNNFTTAEKENNNNKHCLQISASGAWNRVDCYTKQNFMCEKY